MTKLETSKGALAFGYDDLLRQTTKLSDQFRETYTYTTQAGNANQTSTKIAQIAYTGVTSYFTNTTLGYTYDALGNIKTVSRDGVTTEYSYDNQGQLTKEETRNASNAITSTYTYTYDTYGNIREKKVYSGAATSGNLEKTYTYSYPTNGWLDELTGISIDGGSTQSFTYDAIGNPLTYKNGTSWAFTWKNGRQLATANASGKDLSYTYDVDGIRTSKTVNGVTHSYTTLNGQVVRETWTENGTAHVLDILTDNNSKPYALVYDGTTYYYVLNQQGDVIRLVDGNGATYANYSYNAWGEPVRVYLDNGSEITAADNIANLNPIRYRGYYYDTETGFYYVGSRYYDPVLCRFVSADDAEFLGADKKSLNYNMFAYCGNNPVIYADSEGNFANAVIGAIVGGVTGYFNARHSNDNRLAGVIVGAVTGAVSGLGVDIALASGGVGAIAIAAVLGATGNGLNYGLNEKANGRKPDIGKLAIEAGVGAAFNAISFGTAGGSTKKVAGGILNNMKKNFTKTFLAGTTKRVGGRTVYKTGKAVFKRVLRNFRNEYVNGSFMYLMSWYSSKRIKYTFGKN